jgi:hypothetical protein
LRARGLLEGELIERLEALLIAAAREQRLMTYAEVARALELPPPHTIHRAALLIEEMMRHHAAAGSPQLASLVISKARGGLPAPGYFVLLAELNLYEGPASGTQAQAFHSHEVARCFTAALA